MACYCGFSTVQNKVRWAVAALFTALSFVMMRLVLAQNATCQADVQKINQDTSVPPFLVQLTAPLPHCALQSHSFSGCVCKCSARRRLARANVEWAAELGSSCQRVRQWRSSGSREISHNASDCKAQCCR